MPYHEIHHFSTSINLRGCHFPLRGQTPVSQPTTHQPRLVDSSSLRTFCPCLYYQAIEQTFQDPSIFEPVSLDPASLVTSLVTSLQQQHGKAYPWAVGNGRQLPAGYILAKRKKAFRSGRPIISFVDAPFRPMLNILARLIFQLIPVACPDHFASGDVHTLLTILKVSAYRRRSNPGKPRFGRLLHKHRSRTFRECMVHANGLPSPTYGCSG